MVNIERLQNKLTENNIEFNGVSEKGIVWGAKNEEIQDREDVATIIASCSSDDYYTELRKVEYPSITDQLDMLYHDKKEGTTTWEDTIETIKLKYPKE